MKKQFWGTVGIVMLGIFAFRVLDNVMGGKLSTIGSGIKF